MGLLNASALVSYASGVRKAFGQTTAVWYLIFQISQFHVIYYASRTLSNMFAFGISTIAMRALLPEPIGPDAYRKRCRVALYLLTIAGVVFRAELALFLAAHTIFLLLTGRISIRQEIIPAGTVGLLVGLASTISLDSFFWQQFPLWPELAAFKFNVVSGQASAWGEQPWHYYFSNAIPRLLLNPSTYLAGLPVALVQPSTRLPATSILIPSLAFVAVYSIQPHKEWRFIVYTIPPLTAASALGASYIWTHRAKSLLYRLLSLLSVLSTLAAFLFSTFVLLPASSANYPGAHALRTLHRTADSCNPEISVYLGNLACQTGVTHFLEAPAEPRRVHARSHSGPGLASVLQTFRYDKTENETVKASPDFWESFDYLLIEPGDEESRIRDVTGGSVIWDEDGVVDGFAGLKVLAPGEEAAGLAEERLLRAMFGSDGPRLWGMARDLARRSLTRGWWVEVRMEPRIKILRRDVFN